MRIKKVNSKPDIFSSKKYKELKMNAIPTKLMSERRKAS
jgi:hypothetical protein